MSSISRKSIKKLLLRLMKFTGLFALTRHLSRNGLRILCYHGVWLGDEGYPGDGMFMNPATFESRLDCLQIMGFPVLPLERAVEGLYSGDLLPCPVVITIDDGWYSTWYAMLPALKRHNMPATIYCDTNHLQSRIPVPHVMARYLKHLVENGYLHPESEEEISGNTFFKEAVNMENSLQIRLENVRKLAASLSIDFEHYVTGRVFSYMEPEQLAEACRAGLDVQLHTHTHSMHDFNAGLIINEIEENRRQLSQITGIAPEKLKHFCYPSGVHSRENDPVLAKAGIVSATTTEQSIASKSEDRYFLPRILDGEHLSPIEFEAELCGVMEMLRRVRRVFVPGDRQ